MNNEDLKEIIRLHDLYLKGNKEGKCANLSGVNLSDAILIDANLSDAILIGANLSGAILIGANLRGANLSGANLSGAILRGAVRRDADLSDADLRYADLRYAHLSGADLRYSYIRCANLRGANLRGANLSGADLRDVMYNEKTSFFAMQCPEEGSFIAWKKCRNNTIVKLEIPFNAKRSSGTSRKCRASEARVLAIYDKNIDEATSQHDKTFIYKVGETVKVDNFDEDRWNECSTGIHFFITKQEAINYL